jgi:hypothetical protein
MDGLRLFGLCGEAAQNYSRHESVDVLVIRADGSGHVYINGNEREIPWLGAPMPLKPLGHEASFPDMTPTEVQLGRWSDGTNDEIEGFIPSQTMSVADFLSLAALINRTAHARSNG